MSLPGHRPRAGLLQLEDLAAVDRERLDLDQDLVRPGLGRPRRRRSDQRAWPADGNEGFHVSQQTGAPAVQQRSGWLTTSGCLRRLGAWISISRRSGRSSRPPRTCTSAGRPGGSSSPSRRCRSGSPGWSATRRRLVQPAGPVRPAHRGRAPVPRPGPADPGRSRSRGRGGPGPGTAAADRRVGAPLRPDAHGRAGRRGEPGLARRSATAGIFPPWRRRCRAARSTSASAASTTPGQGQDRLASRLVRLEPVDAILGADHPMAGAGRAPPRRAAGERAVDPGPPGQARLPAALRRPLRHPPSRRRQPRPGPPDQQRPDRPGASRCCPPTPRYPRARGPLGPLVDPTPLYAWSLIWRRPDRHPARRTLLPAVRRDRARAAVAGVRAGRDWLPAHDQAELRRALGVPTAPGHAEQ